MGDVHVHAVLEQEVDRSDRAPPTTGDPPGRVVQLGGRAVDRYVSMDTRHPGESLGEGSVDEPAVGVERNPHSGNLEAVDQAEEQLPAEQGLPAGEHRLDDAERDPLVDHPKPVVVGKLRGASKGVPRRVGVAEAAAQVAGVGELELHPERTLRRLGSNHPRAPPEPPGDAPQGEALLQ
jgi:hypothetical protein